MERSSVGGNGGSGLSYFDLDRLYTECVERGESNTIGSVISQATYALCWNAFTKWCQSQIELNRAVNMGSFGTIGFSAVRDGVKVVYIKLSDTFLGNNGLQYKQVPGQLEIESQQNIIMNPTVKPNFAAMAKTANMDKQILQNSLNNFFQLIGDLLQEGPNVEVDLYEFGKFSSINRSIIYAPLNKQKPSAFQGKQTVKSLMEIGAGQNKLSASGQKLAGFIDPNQMMMMSSKLPGQLPLGMQSQGPYNSQMGRSYQGGSANDSPTRRFKKPHGEAKISSDLLGAGDDPMAKNQEFSLIANNPAQLMSMSFKKPSKAISRYPPVIDPFSRTLAAPISSQRHYFSVCHRIGTNFTPSGKGFFIDTDTRNIKYKDVNDTGTKLDIVNNDDVEPADEREEYRSLMNPGESDKRRVQARRVSYQRYRQYVDNEIPVDVIAPIRQYWLSHIIELIPGDLHAVEKSRIEDLIDTMLNEINKDYFDSVKKSILDYILKDDNEMRRLGIQQVLNRPIDWGDDFYKGIEPNEEWKHNVMMARMLMSENLSICSHATLQLMKLWQDYENHIFISLPQPREKAVILGQFTENQDNQMKRVKHLLSTEWNKNAVDILRVELENLDKDQTATFFESVATLMANQVRELIAKSVKTYVEFFRRFRKPNDEYPTPKEIMNREFDPDTPLEDNFLVLNLSVNNTNQIVFADPLGEVKEQLLNMVNEIVKQSEYLPRPENTIARSEKLHLWHVPEDDEVVRNAKQEISEILEKNMQVVEKSLHVYDDYLFILKEKQRVDAFLAESSSYSREEFAKEISRFQQTQTKISETMPKELRMNMFLIDCTDLNKRLCDECSSLIDRILNRAQEYVLSETSTGIFSMVKGVGDKFALRSNDSTAELVKSEREFEDFKLIKRQEIISKYNDLVDWLCFLYANPRLRVQEDQVKTVKSAHDQILKIQQFIDQKEKTLRLDREEVITRLANKRKVFQENLDKIKSELEKFREYTNKRIEDEYNKKIAQINTELVALTEEMKEINDMEVDLDEPPTEYPDIDKFKLEIKPFEELWRMVKESEAKKQIWTEGSLRALDPEEVEKDHKTIWQTAQKLVIKFQQSIPKMPRPEKVAKDIVEEMLNFRKYLPVIRSICNPGLKDRHFDDIFNLIGKRIDNSERLRTLITLKIEQFAEKLDEVSETASKEFSNERTLQKMADDWAPMEFLCKEYRSSFILEGEAIELITALLDDHIIKAQTMKGSPFAKVFIDQITRWENNLLRTQENLDTWLKVQSAWLYLEPVFSSEDILNQMPVEGGIFKDVDNQWRQMMSTVNSNPKATVIMENLSIGEILKECFTKLERVQKGLNSYLESKRGLFPRFCFLSDGELLEILSETKEPLRVQPHLKKCFEGIAALEFDEEKKIHGMYSSEGELVPFTRIIDPVASKGAVENWLCQVEDVMLKSVKDVVEKSLQDYTKAKSRDEWVMNWQGQAVLAVDMIFWTSLAEEAMKKSGLAGLQQFYDKLNKELNAIVALVRQDIDKLQRCTLEAMIVLDVHARDVIMGDLIKNNICDPSEFNWLAQLRYYWEDNNVNVKIINAELAYNYEYLGNSPRLVITPLTDRCYRTLCGALFLKYGGAPEGPAGTGKTETVKDLAKALARHCIVFNCSDGLDYKQMGKFFKGLASCGAWSCFDEFNRIELEVLSVIAQQFQSILYAIEKQMERFNFEGQEIPLKFTCNCFITMNPGYAGRSELPDNLKALFRSVAMMVPDYAMIAEISLYSFGFTDAKPLSNKIVTTYKLCSEQLSSQDHYDYGMRAVKSVLTAAGNLKRKFTDENESIVMLRAINDVNLAKFLAPDVPLFKNITSDLFPGIVLPEPDYTALIACMKNQINILNLQAEDYFIEKVIQLYEMIIVRHGLMVVGMPFSGKTSALKVLAQSLTELNEKGLMKEMKTHIQIVNPKSITMGQLYGNFDEVSHDWSDGILAVWYRVLAAQMDKKDRRWLIFDGPVDAIWIENMNTVLDDNKKLCLMSGEIIQMSENMNMIFEPMDLAVASPATVSRCGMVYMEPHQIGWRPIFNSWKNKLPKCFNEDHIKTINTLVDVIVQPCFDFVRSECHETTPTQDQNLLTSCLKIWRGFLVVFDNDHFITTLDKKQVHQIIESCFIFSAVWSLCISINTEFRRPFDMHFKKICNGELDNMKVKLEKKILPSTFDRGLIYDYIYFPEKNEWKHWMDLVNKDSLDQFPKGTQVQDIIVTTIDTIRYNFLQEFFIQHEIQSLFVGPTGTGKSAYIQNVLQNKLNREKFITIEVGFSAQTQANQVQDIIDMKLDKRRKDYFGPKFGMRCIIFVDDLNMPKKENYGAQPPIEILRQLVDQGGWYDRKDSKHPFRNIIDTMIISAMGPPGGGKTFITPRFQRHFNIIAFALFDENTMNSIFKTILKWYFRTYNFASDVAAMEAKLVTGTMKVYQKIQEDLKPTPMRSHYTFNLRDFSKIICGICMAGKNQIPNADVGIRIWAHEVLRVLGDRLINNEDRMWMLNALKDTVRGAFGANFDQIFAHLDIDKNGKVETLDELRGLIFGDVLTPFGMSERPYEEIQDREKLQQCCEEALGQYNMMTEKPMDLVLFSFALEHLVRISRILKQPSGHAMLVGVGGSGRQSLTRLASKMGDNEVYQVEIKKNYRMQEWRDDMKNLFRMCGGKGVTTSFIFTDTQIKEEGFLEDVNNILNTGEIPNLYPPDEKADICEMVRGAAKSENRCPEGTPAQLFSYFVERCKKKLHIVLCFSPIGESFRGRVRNFPSLVNCTTIDWFSEWPNDALESVAKRFLGEIEMEPQVRNSCVKLVQMFHESTAQAAVRFKDELRRHYYVTPTSYLELITTFKTILKEKREEVMGLKNRYENGYTCLISTESNVSKMRLELEALQPKLIEASKDTEIKEKIVEGEAVEAEKIRVVVAADEAVASKAAGEANAIKEDCEKELSEAMPILQSASKALECITPNDITLAKKMLKPPEDQKMVLSAVCVLMGLKPEAKMNSETQKKELDFWPVAIKMMNGSTFLKDLQEYDKEGIEEDRIKKLQDFVKNPKFNLEHLKGISSIACNLASWVIAMDKFYAVNLIVKPKKAALAEANAKYAEIEGKLKIKQAELKVVQDKVNGLLADLKETKDFKIKLENDVADCQAKLERAQKLISGLGGEKARWKEQSAILTEIYRNLTGDVLVASGMIAYLGAFTSVFRDNLSTLWVSQCTEKHIPSAGKFSLPNTLGNPVLIREWNISGLPSDNFSIENAIINQKARRWPLFIDPQGQANKWIRNMEKGRKIKILKFSNPNYLRDLENAIPFGTPVMMENVGQEMDPAIEPVLQKQIFKKGSSWNIRLGDNTIEYNKDFKFYMTTKLRNPHYLPEVSTKVTLINFMITYEGLSDQLLGIVVEKENPELQLKKEQLVIESAQNKTKLEEIEDQILKVLSNSSDILGDAKGIEILSNAKIVSDDIAKKQVVAEKTEKEIDEARVGYRPVAERTAGLFFCITDLANIDPMYQYSLGFFINLFIAAIANSQPSEDLQERLNYLNAEFLISLYRNICRSLFEKDKLIFSFLLTCKLLEMRGDLDYEEFRFFLTGGISLGGALPKAPADWLSEKSWGEILRLEEMPAFKGFVDHFRAKVNLYQVLYDSPNPHEQDIKDPFYQKLTPFQKIMILRCLRGDKAVPAITGFVVHNLGKDFVTPPPFELPSIYKDSTSTTPLIFVLSPGSDPLNFLVKFAESKKKQIDAVSLGQGQGDKAAKLIQNALVTGNWVVLQNCHLAVSWMGTLEKICEDLSPDHRITHREFRLWLTSYPSGSFPVSILQNGVKMTNEPPKGLRANLNGSYLLDPISNQKEFFDNCIKPREFRKMVFGLTFFHAVIQERRKFGPLGWNIPYEFNDNDLRISVRQLRIFINQYPEKTPFEALKYLTGECNYGGKVTDDKDRRLLATILDDFYNEKIFDDEYKFSPSGIYFAPPHQEYEKYQESIAKLPLYPAPEVFGLHANADITKDNNETFNTFEAILSTQQNAAVGGGSKNQDEIIERLANQILADIPEPFNVRAAEKKYPVKYEQSMNTVLTQELIRFNGLINTIRNSLKDLKKAIKGEVLLSAQLEDALKSLLDGKVPALWKGKSYPSLKPLGGYVADLKSRLEFFQTWIDQGIPQFYWINKFYFTQGFLTGAIQNYARKYGIAIDGLIFDFEINQEDNPPAPEDGINVYGMYIEGCKWNYNKRVLDESDPKILFVKAPMIWFKPCVKDEISNYQNYNCPVYKTGDRRGTLMTTGHSTNFVLMIRMPSDQPQSHWIKRGVAMLCSLND